MDYINHKNMKKGKGRPVGSKNSNPVPEAEKGLYAAIAKALDIRHPNSKRRIGSNNPLFRRAVDAKLSAWKTLGGATREEYFRLLDETTRRIKKQDVKMEDVRDWFVSLNHTEQEQLLHLIRKGK